MYKIIWLLSICFLPLFSFAQTKTLKEGSVLTYKVKSAGKEYDFIVTVKKLEGITAFDWKMTAPINKSGTITITEAASFESYAWYNYFAEGKVDLDKETSVFISFMMDLDITITSEGAELEEPVKLNGASQSGEVMIVKKKQSPYTYASGGQNLTMNTVHLQNKNGDKWVRIFNDGGRAYIVEMHIGFDITLSSIQY